MLIYKIEGLLKTLGMERKLSQTDTEGMYVFDCHQSTIAASWRGHIITIQDQGYGIGKGYIRYIVYLHERRVHGTKICRMLGIDWGEDSAPRRLWATLKYE